MDIVIYTTPEKLRHKRGIDEPHEEYYWYMSRPPKKFNEGDKIFFAIKEEVVGYFICNDFYPHSQETVCWNKNSWIELKEKIPTKVFRGFRYKWW